LETLEASDLVRLVGLIRHRLDAAKLKPYLRDIAGAERS
jgi:hypothetical protein